MLKKTFGVLIFAILVIFAAMPARAWDETGHKLTAYIAWQQMTPETRDMVIKLLRAAPEDAQLSTFYMGFGGRSEEARRREFFMVVATWADIIRDRDFEVRMKKYHHSNWHYKDTFWKTGADGKPELLPDTEDGGKAMEKLADFDKVIRSNDPDKEKAIAVAWLVHLIGDIHQPLHASGRVTDLEPKGDQGGNTFLLTPKDTPRDKQENLHWFWDSIVGRAIPRKNDACDADYLDPIGKAIMKQYPYAKMKDRIAPGKFEQWKEESLKAAEEQVYSADLKRFEMPSPAYKKKALKLAEERLALAGYRMGELFNEVFGAKKPTATATAGSVPCKVIRRVMYPVTQTSSVKQTLEIALLDLCPAQVAARPMYSFMVDGKPVMKEYDVVKIFKSETEARKYAADNDISDVSLSLFEVYGGQTIRAARE
jgi:hypothetical protein